MTAIRDGLNFPAVRGFVITPGDIVANTASPTSFPSDIHATRAIIVSGAGNINVTLSEMQPNEQVVIPVQAGLIYALSVTRVWATSTTATGIVGLV